MPVSTLEKIAIVVCWVVLGSAACFWSRQVLAAIELLQMAQG